MLKVKRLKVILYVTASIFINYERWAQIYSVHVKKIHMHKHAGNRKKNERKNVYILFGLMTKLICSFFINNNSSN